MILRLLRAGERPLVLLDGAELRRRLRLDLHEEVLRGLLRKILRRERLRLALAVADLDLGRDVLRDLGAEAEGLVLGKEAVPLLGELRIVREVMTLPMLDRVVILLRKRPDVVFHTSRVRVRTRMVIPFARANVCRQRVRLTAPLGRSTVPRRSWGRSRRAQPT